jgi:hypothetical protein
METVFSADLGGMDAFSTVHHAAAATIAGAGSADSEGMLAAALGPIGASYLAAYAPAHANNRAATRLVPTFTPRSATQLCRRKPRLSPQTTPEEGA